MRHPIAAKQRIGELRQRDIAVLGAFAPVDVDHLPRPVDIGDFQKQPFLQAETAGIDGHQIDVVVEGGDFGQDLFDFFAGKHGGQTLLPLGPGQEQKMPLPLQDMLEEELDAGMTDAHGGR